MRWLAIVVFLALPLLGQVKEDASYEGQPVASVQLVSDPRVDVESYRSKVEQAAGQPFSWEKIRASVDALKETGRFSKVELQVKPSANGLELNFVLEPAFYVGIIRFPGATKVFSYTRLLQIVNMPDEELYQKEHVSQAQSALLKFLQNNGFYQAKVDSKTELDDPHQLASVSFNVELGKRARIGKVEITGASPAENAKLLHAVQGIRAKLMRAALKPGKTFTLERQKAAIKQLKRQLSGQKYLQSRVNLAAPVYRAETNRVDLNINVTTGPKAEVQVTGARFSLLPFASGRIKRKLIPIYDEGTIDRDLVREGQRNLVNFFQEKGYFDAQVKTDFKRTLDKISLTYIINKGAKHNMDDVSFEGNQNLSDGKLKPAIEIKQKHFLSRGKFSDKLLRKSVSDIEALYHNAGFEEVQVHPEVVDREPQVDVTFQIVEGPQTVVENMELKGNDTLGRGQLQPANGFSLHPGAPFSPKKMADDRSHILAAYLDRGYLNADVQSTVTRHQNDPHKVDVTYSITEHQQVRVSEVVMLGEKVTRRSLIGRVANIYPEMPLSQGRLLAGESELYNLGIFDWASVGPRRPISDQTEEEALIKLHEAKRNTITYGVGLEIAKRGGNVPAGTLAVPGLPTIGLGGGKVVASEKTFVSPRGTLQFTRRNIRGLAETATVSLLLARLDQRLLGTYTDPHFRGSQWRALTSLSAERTTQNPLFAATLGSGSIQFERTLDRARSTTAQFRYEFSHTSLSQILIPQVVLPEDRSVRLSTLSAAILHDTRDKPLDAHSGRYETLNLGITPRLLGSSASFARMLGQYAYYRPVGGIVWANSIRLGLAKAYNGSFVPTSERFFSGGGTTLRGFPIDGAGPQRSVTICTNPNDTSSCIGNIRVPIGGNQLFVLNSELRIPLPIKDGLGLVAFYDGGNVYRNISLRQFVDDYTNTVGVGLRYSTPIGPVRFDVGRNLNPITGISATQFFVTLGQAF
jgi:outer membrane protein insertion porin family